MRVPAGLIAVSLAACGGRAAGIGGSSSAAMSSTAGSSSHAAAIAVDGGALAGGGCPIDRTMLCLACDGTYYCDAECPVTDCLGEPDAGTYDADAGSEDAIHDGPAVTDDGATCGAGQLVCALGDCSGGYDC